MKRIGDIAALSAIIAIVWMALRLTGLGDWAYEILRTDR